MTVTADGPIGEPLAKPNLSAREIEVLRQWLLTDSKSSAAEKLYISPGTVNTHLARIREKYTHAGRTASTKCELLVRAFQDHIVTIDEF
ncbi:DNA-binding CsgD family transcriptional regulator [Rhodococcus sp. 27YEA15]|uniref:response regulator transcription factor n=1 Tax=Rhodococcus sp. 27YEA15 TaxID=3156259 RepID=UPI003C7B86CA